MSAAVWYVARESADLFIGPLTVTVTESGQPADTATLSFALLPSGQRPGDTDWQAPAANPEGGGTVGLFVQPVTDPGMFGWWVKITDGESVDVLEPAQVAWVVRT